MGDGHGNFDNNAIALFVVRLREVWVHVRAVCGVHNLASVFLFPMLFFFLLFSFHDRRDGMDGRRSGARDGHVEGARGQLQHLHWVGTTSHCNLVEMGEAPDLGM